VADAAPAKRKYVVKNGNDTRFKPGQSGNPAGPPKRAIDLARKAAIYDDEVLAMYVAIIRDKKATRKDKLTAGQALLDRGYGRPGQSIMLQGDTDKPLVTGQLTAEQMAEVVAAARNLDDDV
jgi:hypothetical protein